MEEEHYCFECGHYNYDSTMFNGENCDCEEGCTCIVSGRETDCEYWKSKNHPDIINKNKIDKFFNGFERYPNMNFIYDNCFKDVITSEDATTEELESFIVEIMGKTYNAAVERCRRILFENRQSVDLPGVDPYRKWTVWDRIQDTIDRAIKHKLSCSGFEVVSIEKNIPDYSTYYHYKLVIRYTKDDNQKSNNLINVMRDIFEYVPEHEMERITFEVKD